jgi:uncharacterized membrane protein
VSDDEGVDEVEELLEELEGAVDTPEERRVAASGLARLSYGRLFGLDDLAQQIVGGVVLSAPFVVTEEVWSLAASMSWLQWGITVLMVVVIGWGALYRADADREAESEESIAGLPLRFVSLVCIAYGSVALLAVVFDAPGTFGADVATSVRAVSIGAIFSVVGAATADSLF